MKATTRITSLVSILFISTLVDHVTGTFRVKGRQFAHVFGKRNEDSSLKIDDSISSEPFNFPVDFSNLQDDQWSQRFSSMERLPLGYRDFLNAKDSNSFEPSPQIVKSTPQVELINRNDRQSLIGLLQRLRSAYNN